MITIIISDNRDTIRGCIDEEINDIIDCRYEMHENGFTDWFCMCTDDLCNQDFKSCECRTQLSPLLRPDCFVILSQTILSCLYILLH